MGKLLEGKTARSQIMGGAIFGIGAALMEGTVRDPNLARYTNASLANYHVPVNADIPAMTVEFIDEKDPYINAMGVKGIGEVLSWARRPSAMPFFTSPAGAGARFPSRPTRC
jgi:xanthine dehydrogenase YagR molybdenum-binding subunit